MHIAKMHMVKGGVALVDAIAVLTALCAAYSIRFDFSLQPFYLRQLQTLLPIVLLIRLSALYYARSYQFVWRYAGINDLVRVLEATLAGLVLLAVVNYFRNYPLGLLIAALFFVSALFHRGFLHYLPRIQHKRLVIGAAAAASVVLLSAGVAVFTIVRSAPVHVGELPLGGYLQLLDFQQDLAMPRGVLVMESIISFILICGVRIAPRIFSEFAGTGTHSGRRTLIFGAGDLGESIVRSLRKDHSLGHRPVGFVDDDPTKQRISIHGVRVLGTRQDLAQLIDEHRVDEVLIAVGSLSDEDLRQIGAACWQKRVAVRRVPSLASMVDPAVGLRNLESIDIEDLLGRPEVKLDPASVREYLKDRVVLVTGAGGSIGSELCRQISRCAPAQLLLLGKGENSIYLIQKELATRYPDVETVSVIADVAAPGKMEYVFGKYQPAVVFHAAAYKHVPFMEESPEESVLNNIFGTRTLAATALRHGCGRFVMISTDKAVNPSSMMGATKRGAELVLQDLAKAGDTRFVTVRFGNVLRSRGSVIPLFEKQITAGGPVTVTHPEMKRYFMSIPEAVRLVLHSGAIAGNGDLCILDMGEQVRIVTLAENMIRMSGKVPYDEVDIVFTGIRPGEKLYEELLTDQEARCMRKVDKIFVSRPDGGGAERLAAVLPRLREAALRCDGARIRGLLMELIPSYVPSPGEPLPTTADDAASTPEASG